MFKLSRKFWFGAISFILTACAGNSALYPNPYWQREGGESVNRLNGYRYPLESQGYVLEQIFDEDEDGKNITLIYQYEWKGKTSTIFIHRFPAERHAGDNEQKMIQVEKAQVEKTFGVQHYRDLECHFDDKNSGKTGLCSMFSYMISGYQMKVHQYLFRDGEGYTKVVVNFNKHPKVVKSVGDFLESVDLWSHEGDWDPTRNQN